MIAVSRRGWATASLQDVCEKITDGTHHSPPNSPAGQFMYVTAKNIRRHGIDLTDISYVDAATHREIYARCPVAVGDVLYIKDGATTGLAVVNTIPEPFSLLSSVALLKPRRDLLDASYLKHWLNSPETFESMVGQMTGSAIRRLTLRTIASQMMAVPPLAEQRRIVARIEALFARTRRARADLARVAPLSERHRRQRIRDAFDDDIAKGWPLRRLEDLISDARIGLVRSKAEQSDAGGIPYVRMQHYDALGRWNTEDLTYVSASDTEIRQFELRDGDLLFNTRNSVELVGKIAIWPAQRSGHVYNNNLLRLRFTPGVVPQFMRWALMAPPAADILAGVKSATTSVAAIYQRDLLNVVVRLPPEGVQREVAKALDASLLSADLAENEAARALALLDRLEQSILAKAFRGELVPQDPSDEPASVGLVNAQEATTVSTRRGRPRRAA